MTTTQHITLSELLSSVRGVLAERFALGVWISAEVGSLNVNRYSGHCYMELIEKGDDNLPKAKVSAAVWRSKWASIGSYFASATGTPLTAGIKVLLKVSVTFHELYGLSLVINDIDPAYTLGEQERLRRQTIEQLKADGIFDLNRQLPLPTVIQRVAVVSSATAAGWGDFSNHISSSPYRIEPTLFEAIVQGGGAENSVIAALDAIAARADEFDAVAILRGGGSQSDLECFNAYPIACHIAEFPLPVITGIGHDRDISVADMVAAVAQKTPTAVADYLVAIAEAFYTESESLYERTLQATEARLASSRQLLERNAARVQSGASGLLRRLDVRLEGALIALRHGTQNCIERHRSALSLAEATVEGNNPERILAKGFAVVRHEGKAVTDPSQLPAGARVELQLAEGRTEATITKN